MTLSIIAFLVAIFALLVSIGAGRFSVQRQGYIYTQVYAATHTLNETVNHINVLVDLKPGLDIAFLHCVQACLKDLEKRKTHA